MTSGSSLTLWTAAPSPFHWADHGLRYGEREEVAQEIADELLGKFNEAALEQVKAQALGTAVSSAPSMATINSWLTDENWQLRLVAIEELARHDEAVPRLIQASNDPKLATAALDATGSADAIVPLCARKVFTSWEANRHKQHGLLFTACTPPSFNSSVERDAVKYEITSGHAYTVLDFRPNTDTIEINQCSSF